MHGNEERNESAPNCHMPPRQLDSGGGEVALIMRGTSSNQCKSPLISRLSRSATRLPSQRHLLHFETVSRLMQRRAHPSPLCLPYSGCSIRLLSGCCHLGAPHKKSFNLYRSQQILPGRCCTPRHAPSVPARLRPNGEKLFGRLLFPSVCS